MLVGIGWILSRCGSEPTNSVSSETQSRTSVSQVDPAEAERQRAVDAAAKAKKEADCRADLQCWGEKGSIAAGIYCRDKIAKTAEYTMKWTDAWYEQKFSRFRWSRKQPLNQGVVTYIGDKAQFQNGYGAFQNVIYTCDMIPDDKEHVIFDVSVKPGRLE